MRRMRRKFEKIKELKRKRSKAIVGYTMVDDLYSFIKI